MNSDKNTSRIAETSPLKYARLAGLLYLGFVPLALFGFPYGPSHLFVPGDTALTADNITASETLFRFGIVNNLLGAVLSIFVVLALYRLLKPVNKNMALLMVIFNLVAVPIGMLNELNHVAALLLLGDASYLTPFTASQLQALVPLFHDLHSYGLSIATVFWALWLFPMGYLVFKSRVLLQDIGELLQLHLTGNVYL